MIDKQKNQDTIRQGESFHLEAEQGNPRKKQNSIKNVRDTPSACQDSPNNTELIAITYEEDLVGADPCRPQPCCFSLWEPMCALLSFFRVPCFPDVLQTL